MTVSSADDGDQWWNKSIGYTKLGNRWVVAFREASGQYSDPDMDSSEIKEFAEAPRWARIEGISKLPKLLEALLQQAEETIQRIRKGVQESVEIVTAIRQILPPEGR